MDREVVSGHRVIPNTGFHLPIVPSGSIHFRLDRFEVVRIDTPMITTQMIDMERVRHPATLYAIHHSAGDSTEPLTPVAGFDDAVPIRVYSAPPVPASAAVNIPADSPQRLAGICWGLVSFEVTGATVLPIMTLTPTPTDCGAIAFTALHEFLHRQMDKFVGRSSALTVPLDRPHSRSIIQILVAAIF